MWLTTGHSASGQERDILLCRRTMRTQHPLRSVLNFGYERMAQQPYRQTYAGGRYLKVGGGTVQNVSSVVSLSMTAVTMCLSGCWLSTEYGNCPCLVVIRGCSVLTVSIMITAARKLEEFRALNGHLLQKDTLTDSVSEGNIFDLKRVVRQSTP